MEEQAELTREVAGLPSELTDPDLEAKLFDLLILRLQLALLWSECSFTRLQKSVVEIAGLLEDRRFVESWRLHVALLRQIIDDHVDEFDLLAAWLPTDEELIERRFRSLPI